MSGLLVTYLSFLIWALNLAIFGRVIMSWISPTGNDPVSNILSQITEPILAPIRKVVPPLGMFDLAPLIALLLLNLVIRPVILSLA